MDLVFFKKVPANFSPSPLSGKKFPTRPEGSGKMENVNLIKLAENFRKVFGETNYIGGVPGTLAKYKMDHFPRKLDSL